MALLDSDATLMVLICRLVTAAATAGTAAPAATFDEPWAPESVEEELLESEGFPEVAAFPPSSSSSVSRNRTFPAPSDAGVAAEGEGAAADAEAAWAAAADSDAAAWMLPMEDADMGERIPLSSDT